MRISLAQVRAIAAILQVNTIHYPLPLLQYAMQIELEHGTHDSRTNVTNDDLLMTAKIALAHLAEFPDYYHRLMEMEQAAHEYWEGRKKPALFFLR